MRLAPGDRFWSALSRSLLYTYLTHAIEIKQPEVTVQLQGSLFQTSC
jgi:hypothetical protein